MAYTARQTEELNRQCDRTVSDLRSLTMDGLVQCEEARNERAVEYLRHGVGRRLDILRKGMEQIFALFPPSQERPLPRETLAAVQLYLHAFVINVAGVLDNWAWAFVFRHALLDAIGDRRNVDLFKRATQRFLPATLREYLISTEIERWQAEYLSGYRDALAHRIPLYIPPAAFSEEDSSRYERLEKEKAVRIKNHDWDRLDAIWAEQQAIGTASPVFMQSFSPEEGARPVFLHPQVLTDGVTVVEIGKRFYASWHQCAR